MLTEFCPLLTYPRLKLVKEFLTVIRENLHKYTVDIFSTIYLPNIVKERPLTYIQYLKSLYPA